MACGYALGSSLPSSFIYSNSYVSVMRSWLDINVIHRSQVQELWNLGKTALNILPMFLGEHGPTADASTFASFASTAAGVDPGALPLPLTDVPSRGPGGALKQQLAGPETTILTLMGCWAVKKILRF